MLQARGAEPAVLYLDQVTGDVADAYTPRVRYITNGNNIHIRLRLERGEERIERLINLPGGDVSAIATAVAKTFVEMAPTQ